MNYAGLPPHRWDEADAVAAAAAAADADAAKENKHFI
jgi:hypothetical protein